MSKSMLFLYVETPLHAGTGRGLGTVDLPIQRERTTGYPMIQASGIKGRLRAQMKSNQMSDEELWAVFGPETENASDYAGALSFGDARLLLFPVRSLAGVFAWATSVDALARFYREAVAVGQTPTWKVPTTQPKDEEAWVNGNALTIEMKDESRRVVLEEFSFTVSKTNIETKAIGEWLALNALPKKPSAEAIDEYQYWRDTLPLKLCILPEDAFRDFVLYATEVQTHIKLNPDTKTVDAGALWTAESLPVDTVMYTPLIAQKSRSKQFFTAEEVLKKISAPKEPLPRINFGGDETTGQGFVALRFLGGEK